MTSVVMPNLGTVLGTSNETREGTVSALASQ